MAATEEAKVEETSKIWMDGEFVAWKNATVHVLTHTLHYGLGVFEGIRCYETDGGPAVFRLTEHVGRLYESAHIAGLSVPYSRETLAAAIVETVRVNGMKDCHIRPLIYLRCHDMDLSPPPGPAQVAIAVWPVGKHPRGEEIMKGIRVKISSFTRLHANIQMTKAKVCGHYTNSILGKVEAQRDGYDEALFLDCHGNIAEGPDENIFVVKRQSLRTPPATSVLPGITRDTVIEIARWQGVDVHEAVITRDELYTAEEAFFTGTAAEVTPLGEVDRRRIGEGAPGPITSRIMESFSGIVRGRERTFREWLTRV